MRTYYNLVFDKIDKFIHLSFMTSDMKGSCQLFFVVVINIKKKLMMLGVLIVFYFVP